jgi:hypothetical protein
VAHRIAIDPDLPGFLRPTYDELSEANLRDSTPALKRLTLNP